MTRSVPGLVGFDHCKGQAACAAAFVNALKSGAAAPIPRVELVKISRFRVQIEEALR